MKLKNIAKIKTGVVLSRKKAALYQAPKSYKKLTLKSFSRSTVVNPSTLDTFLSVDKINQAHLTQEGDVVVRLRAPSTAIHINKSTQGLIISSLMSVIRLSDPSINSQFLAHYLNSNSIQRIFDIAVKGTAIPMIKTQDIAELTINFPSLLKQNKTIKMMTLLYREQEILKQLSDKKQILTQNTLDTAIKQFQGARL